MCGGVVMRMFGGRGSKQFFSDARQAVPKGLGFLTKEERKTLLEKAALARKQTLEKKKSSDYDFPIIGKQKTQELLNKLNKKKPGKK
jgi:hypothetical protein